MPEKDKKTEKEKQKLQQKVKKEQETVELMIRLYCKGNHRTSKGQLCEKCKELLEYSQSRSANCPFMENKTFCNNCKVHCYKPEMREQIKQVMRYSGPRMIFHHPVMAIQHMYYSVVEKKSLEREGK